jgi:hypothetical protein
MAIIIIRERKRVDTHHITLYNTMLVGEHVKVIEGLDALALEID